MSNIAVDAALSGLRVAQQALDITSTNIANASTEGYTRKILPQESLTIAGKSVGVTGGAAFRRVDVGLQIAEQDQTSLVGEYNIRNKYLRRIMDFHGPSENGMALSSLLGTLANSFTALSAAPEDNNFLNQIIADARQLASKFNSFSDLINELRAQTERDIQSAVNAINMATDNIAQLNQQITKIAYSGQSIADLEDKRDTALKVISQYIDVNTYYEDKTLVVITKEGQPLADNASHPLFFATGDVSSSKYYPGGGLNGLYADGATGTDITNTRLGGEIQGLFELRDSTLPQYEAQLDELAQKLAYRFQQAGLKLFTDSSGNIPANVADPGIVSYIGFARGIIVNTDIINNPDLLRNGTSGNTELSGSNEVIRRIVEFTFGAYEYQKSQGNLDISAGNLITTLGITTNNRINGNTNISTYTDFSTIPNAASLPGTFQITLSSGPTTKNIAVLPTDTAASLVTTINTAFGASVASINSLGQLAFNDNGNIILANVTLGAAAMGDLGFAFGVYNQPSPSFQVRVGTRNPETITISPADTAVNLLAKLNAVTGLTAVLDGSGFLVLTPDEGGDLTLTDTVGTPLNALGMTLSNIPHVSMRQNNLGPAGNLSTGLLANITLSDYAGSIVSTQSEEHRLTEDRLGQEDTFLKTLEKRNANVSGVNIDQEMAELIRLQTAYSAAAKMVSTANELFDTLIRDL